MKFLEDRLRTLSNEEIEAIELAHSRNQDHPDPACRPHRNDAFDLNPMLRKALEDELREGM